jgi:replicative DNA helicase
MDVINLPKNLELEENILGSILLDKRALPLVVNYLNEEIFYDLRHQLIFRTIKQMYDKNIQIDLSTVFQRLIDNKHSEEVGALYLSKITNSVVSTAHLNTHIEVVIELYKRRKLATLGRLMEVSAFDGAESTDDTLATFGKQLLGLQEFGNIYEKTIDQIIMQLNEGRDAAVSGQLLGINTGFMELNNTLCGWVDPDFVIIAARPGMGKTAFMLSSIYHIAIQGGIPTAIFSLEMSSNQLVERLESISCELPLKRLRMNLLTDNEKVHLMRTDDKILTSPIYIEDMGGISVTHLRAKATILKQKYGIKIIFIDYLQLMSGTGKSNQNREQEVSYISRSLKALAKELEVPIIALSQLSRRVEERADKMPQLSDLRESGSIEQDADAVIMLMRPGYYEQTESVEIGGREYSPSDLVVCKVEKNRHGATKNLALRFLPETMTFQDYVQGL